MMPNKPLLQRIKKLYADGCNKEELWAMGFPKNYVAEAIRQSNQKIALPNENTRIYRCKLCRHKVYETHLRGGVCKGCEIRQQVNEERKGQFQV